MREVVAARDSAEKAASEARLGSVHATAGGGLHASLTFLDGLWGAAATLDPLSGAPLPIRMIDALERLGAEASSSRWPLPRDTLQRMLELVMPGLTEILARPRTRLRRAHVRLPPSKARLLDARSLSWLSRQPGASAREKALIAREVLAVVREPSADLLENRVARRVVEDLVRVVKVRRDAVRLRAFDSVLAERANTLGRALTLCTTGLAGSALAEVKPSHESVPNHVLLADRAYQRIWRAHQQLARWKADGAAPESSLIGALAALLAAEVVRVGKATGRVHEQFARIDLDSGEIEPVTGTAAALVCLADEDHSCHATVAIERRTGASRSGFPSQVIQFVRQRWTGNACLIKGERDEALIVAELVDVRPEHGRGAPALVEISQPDGRILLFEVFIDGEGLPHLARSAIDALLPGPRSNDRQEMEKGHEPSSGWKLAALDTAGPRARIATDQHPSPLAGPVLAWARWDLDGEKHWLSGAAGASSAAGHSRVARSTVERDIEVLMDDQALHEPRGLAHTFRILADSLGTPGPGARVAIATPDALGPIGSDALRHALPSRIRGALMVPRSVAAALAWRASPSFPTDCIGQDDLVLVLDSGGPRLSLTCLTARIEPSFENQDGWRWERAVPYAPLRTSAAGTEGVLRRRRCRLSFDAAVSDAIAAGVPAAAIDETVNWAADTEPSTTRYEAVWGPDGSAVAWLRSAPSASDAAGATRTIGEAIEAWLDDLVATGQLSSYVAHARGRSVHLLMVGASLEDASNQDRVLEKMRRYGMQVALTAHLANESIVSGALVAVTRARAGAPTWSDALPELSLEIRTKDGLRTIPIFGRGEIVRPGQVIRREVPDRLWLPAGEACIQFPLRRGDRSSDLAPFRAALSGDPFPLQKPVEVRLEVHFRYAEDAFRVSVRAVDADAPFRTREFEWTPAAEDMLAQHIRNEPPTFYAIEPWPPKDALEVVRLAGIAERFHQAAEFAFEPNRRIKELTKTPEVFWQRVDELRDQVRDDLKPALRAVWTSARPLDIAPATLERALARARTWLVEIVRLPPARGQAPAKPRLPREVREHPRFEALVLPSIECLSALRRDIPSALPREILDRLEDQKKRPATALVFALGRALPHADNVAQRDALQWLFDRVVSAAGSSDPKPLVDPLWSLSTALWSSETFARDLALLLPTGPRILFDAIEAILDRLAGDWVDRPVAVEIERELTFMALGLLRLRGVEGAPDESRLDPRSDAARKLATRFEGAAEKILRKGAQRAPRLKLEGGDDLRRAVTECIRGLRVAHAMSLGDET